MIGIGGISQDRGTTCGTHGSLITRRPNVADNLCGLLSALPTGVGDVARRTRPAVAP